MIFETKRNLGNKSQWSKFCRLLYQSKEAVASNRDGFLTWISIDFRTDSRGLRCQILPLFDAFRSNLKDVRNVSLPLFKLDHRCSSQSSSQSRSLVATMNSYLT